MSASSMVSFACEEAESSPFRFLVGSAAAAATDSSSESPMQSARSPSVIDFAAGDSGGWD